LLLLIIYLFPFFPHVLAVVCIACNPRASTSCLTSPAYVTILYILRTRKNAHGPLLAWKKVSPSPFHCETIARTDRRHVLCSEHACFQGVQNWRCLQGLRRSLRLRFWIWVTAHINKDDTIVMCYFHKVPKLNA
jgi:hypothetical protein